MLTRSLSSEGGRGCLWFLNRGFLRWVGCVVYIEQGTVAIWLRSYLMCCSRILVSTVSALLLLLIVWLDCAFVISSKAHLLLLDFLCCLWAAIPIACEIQGASTTGVARHDGSGPSERHLPGYVALIYQPLPPYASQEIPVAGRSMLSRCPLCDSSPIQRALPHGAALSPTCCVGFLRAGDDACACDQSAAGAHATSPPGPGNVLAVSLDFVRGEGTAGTRASIARSSLK